MFTITIKFDPEAAALLNRLINALEGKHQAEIDSLTARLRATNARLKVAIRDLTPQ